MKPSNAICSNYKYYLLLTLLCFCLYLPSIFFLPMLDRDSATFAQATKQMIESNNYWTINFQDKPRHLKPPGIYWINATFIKNISPHQLDITWPYRLPGVISAWLSVLLTFFFARSIFNKKTAMIAATILAIAALVQIESLMITADATLFLTMILMQGSFWHIYILSKAKQKIPIVWPILLWLGLALGILIKGLTPIVFLLTLAGLWICDRNLSWWRNLKIGYGIIFTLVLTLAWLIPLSITTHSNFLLDMINQDLIVKIKGGQQGHGYPPGFYFFIFPAIFWPGSVFFGPAILFSVRQWKITQYRFLIVWLLSIWLVHEFVPTKLPEYILPLFPAAAILIACMLNQSKLFLISKKEHVFCQISGVCWLLYSLALLFFIVYAPYYVDHHTSISTFGIVFFTLAISIFALFYYFHQQFMRCFFYIIVLAFTIPVILSTTLPSISGLWVSQQIAQAINKLPAAEHNLPVFSPDYSEPSLVFLLGTKRVHFTNVPVTQAKHQPILLVISEEHLTDIVKKNVKIIAHFKGCRGSKSRWVSLYLVKW